jgi:hypothetical protein
VIAVAGTVDPASDRGPIRNGELKKLIVLAPVKICLAFAPGTDHEVEWLGDHDCVGWRAQDARLEEAAVAGFHAVEEFRFGGFEDIFVESEAAEDRFA